MEYEPLTPEFVQQFLRFTAGIQITAEAAVDLLPAIEASRRSLRLLERFDVADVRPSIQFDPLFPYR